MIISREITFNEYRVRRVGCEVRPFVYKTEQNVRNRTLPVF